MANKIEASEELLQAVIISDSYNSRFKPLTQDVPRCLLPLANTPLIEYTLEFLASSGVKQVFIFVCVHADQIRDYIKRSKWSQPSAPFEVRFIPTPDSMSAGDAMRELDAKQLITSDFILLSGDVVSNMAADEIVEEHRKRRETNKDSIMTMVVREANPLHRSKPSIDSAVFVLDSETSQCVSYTPTKLSPRTKRLTLDTEVLLKHNNVEVRNDLIDCNIDICSPDVPALFTENFDYEDIRKDFVHGILTSDLLGKTIHCYVASETYAARVSSLQTYDAVSKDIIARWTYPMVPDNNLLPDQSYHYQRSHIYKEEDVRLGRSALLTSRVVVGAGSRIGEGCVVDESIIGRSCKIDSNCSISGSYLWEGVTIGSGTSITGAVLAHNVVVGSNCVIEKGSILGAGVRIADNTTVQHYSKIYIPEEEEEASDEGLVGAGGHGSLYIESDEEEEDDDDSDEEDHSTVQQKAFDVAGLVYNLSQMNFSDSSISSIASSDSGFEETHRRGSMAASNYSEDEPDANFYLLAKTDLETAIEENHTVEDTMLEMTSLRMRENVSMHEVRIAMLSAFLNEIQKKIVGGGALGSSTQKIVSKWGPLLNRTISPSTLSEDCMDILLSLQLECSRTADRQELFVPLVKFMYDDDILPEDQIVEWFECDKAQDQGQGASQVRKKSAAFVNWLQEAEEDSDQEEDDDDE